MATKAPAAKAATPFADLDDEAVYPVKPSRPFRVGRTWVRPGPGVTLKGKVIKEHADDIAEVHAKPS